MEYKTSSSAFTYTTDSYTPKAGALLLAVVTSSYGSSTGSLNNNATPSSVSGNGLTWTLVQTQTYTNNAQRLSVYRAVTGATPTNTAFTVNFPSATGSEKPKNCVVQMVEVLGCSLSGYNGSDAISGIAQTEGNNKVADATVSAVTTPGTAMLGLFASNQAYASSAVTAESGWNLLSSQAITGTIDVSAHIVSAVNTYDPSAQVTFSYSSYYGGIAIKLEPTEYMFNFPCSSTTTATSGQNFNLASPQTICIAGNATGLNLTLANNGASFVTKSGNLSFSNLTMYSNGSFIVDQGSTVTMTNGLRIDGATNFYVANGATATINGDFVLNATNVNANIYGNLTINGNLTMNSGTKLYVGNTAKLIVTGTINVQGGKVLLNGGTTKAKSLMMPGGSAIEMAGGAGMEVNVFNTNWQANSFVTGPGGGCLGVVGPAGEIANQNNGFQPITTSSDLKICLPSSGVTIGSYFNANKGSALVMNGCSGCTVLLPITLTQFDGIMSSSGISQLSWKVANNTTVSRFVVEYSTNGSQFEKVGSILQQGENSNYRFDHTSTHTGLIYYRLLMYDKDGHASYSRIVSLLQGKESQTRIINIAPTVVNSSTNISLYSVGQQPISISVYDISGRQVRTENKIVHKGLQNVPINLGGIQQGYLFVKIQTQDGQAKTLKIMKM
ncbi:MAG TPA: T9SS type A sorting domain-containing protein [Phnomibacter sp.]|nr:T9SS type A sorting domain-containing protein [Phnomibacter sp.]